MILLALTGLMRVDSAHWITAPTRWAVHMTTVGRTERLVLPDGSQADLNTDSEIDVRFSGKRRDVVLRRGEALFTVRPRANWPFSVQVADTRIHAAGTKFSVRLRESRQADVLVVNGKLSIENWSRPALINAVYRRGAGSVWLTASTGELLSIDAAAVLTRAQLSPAVLARRTAWTDGWLWFAKEPLPEAIAEFNRYHRQRLVLVDPSLASLEIGGRFRSSDLDSFLATLEHSFNIRRATPTLAEQGVDTIYLTGRRCGRAGKPCNWAMVQ